MSDQGRDQRPAHAMTNSHLLVQAFDYHEPATLEEALSLLSRYGGRARVLAGGTNLMVWMRMEQVAPEVVVHTGGLPGLQGVAARDDMEGGLEIGALTKIWELRNSPLLQSAVGALDPIQEAFIEQAAFQCGYCTPGMLMMSKRLLEELPAPSEDDIRDYLKGNRCRCTGFAAIVRAVERCAAAE